MPALLPAVLALIVLTLPAVLILRVARAHLRKRLPQPSSDGTPSIAFLHPSPLSGGGGERVLWAALQATQERYPESPLLVHAAWRTALPDLTEGASVAGAAAAKAGAQFGLDLTALRFTPVDISDLAWLADAASHTRLTLLSQACGMALLGLRAHVRAPACVLVDSANCAFALLAPRLLGAVTMTYTHYPTLSIDMARGVARGDIGVHNAADNARSTLRTAVKLAYYAGFAVLYGAVGWLGIDVAVGNSSWTSGHLRRTWRRRVDTVFPPCPVREDPGSDPAEAEEAADCETPEREDGLIVSVGQFRPEKRHEEQLAIVAKLRKRGLNMRLVMIGGARGADDMARAERLRAAAARDKLPVEVWVNAPRAELRRAVRRASVGLHTMRDEHFGIGVVELMSAGPVVVAHASGGVGADIVAHGESGFLGADADGLADCVAEALGLSAARRAGMVAAARRRARRFSGARFAAGFQGGVEEAMARVKRVR